MCLSLFPIFKVILPTNANAFRKLFILHLKRRNNWPVIRADAPIRNRWNVSFRLHPIARQRRTQQNVIHPGINVFLAVVFVHATLRASKSEFSAGALSPLRSAGRVSVSLNFPRPMISLTASESFTSLKSPSTTNLASGLALKCSSTMPRRTFASARRSWASSALGTGRRDFKCVTMSVKL